MIKMIFHQLWNQRRQNAWIFMELLVVGFFLWTVIDPIYVLTANHSIDRGYNPERVYVVKIGAYDELNANYNKDVASDSLSKEAYWRLARMIRELPEVESFSISMKESFPNSNSWNGTQIYADTASVGKDKGFVYAQRYGFVVAEGSNLFHTYGMKDALTSGEIKLPEDSRNRVFISERLAHRLFNSIDVVGKSVYEDKERKYEVVGVFRDYKHHDYEEPYPLIVRTTHDMEGSSYMNWRYIFVLKLKDGVDANTFVERFRKEVAPMLTVGNYYFNKLETFTELSDNYAAHKGVTNKLRLQYALASFAILCTFLGMTGTFWIRCNARRQEIGVMRSLGAGQGTICRQFLIEAWLLVTVAFVLVFPLLLHHAYVNGMYGMETEQNFVPNPLYWQNNFGTHFAIVLVLSYFLLLLVALVGTYIPVRRAARTLPADALRDE